MSPEEFRVCSVGTFISRLEVVRDEKARQEALVGRLAEAVGSMILGADNFVHTEGFVVSNPALAREIAAERKKVPAKPVKKETKITDPETALAAIKLWVS